MRPRRADSTSDETFRFRLTTEERLRLRAAAQANFQSESAFAREAIVAAACDCLEDDPERQDSDD